jgi:hypothetical protein
MPNYTYSWNINQSWSDDPRFADGNLPFGGRDVHIVLLNGVDISDTYIFELRTGEDGYVKVQIRGFEGRHIEYPEGQSMTATLTGRVEYVVKESWFERNRRAEGSSVSGSSEGHDSSEREEQEVSPCHKVG